MIPSSLDFTAVDRFIMHLYIMMSKWQVVIYITYMKQDTGAIYGLCTKYSYLSPGNRCWISHAI